MNLLVDTHILLWWEWRSPDLPEVARAALMDTNNRFFVSAATIWEIAIKSGLGKLSLSMPYRQWMNAAVNDLGATVLPITIDYADAQAALPPHHRDPFDRILIAQAKLENVSVVTGDTVFERYGVARIW